MEDQGTDAPVFLVTGCVSTKLPSQWIIYITVQNVDKSIERCKALGGKVIDGPRMSGDKPFCVIQDPAGAVAALVHG